MSPLPDQDPLPRDMPDTFGVGSIAVGDKCVLFEVAAAALAGIANQIAGRARDGCRWFDAKSIRLWAVESEWNRYIYRPV